MIIPKPKQYKEQGEIVIACSICADEPLAFGNKAFRRIFKKIHGVSLACGEGGFDVKYDATLEKEEYRVEGARVYASSLLGARNGLATLLQLVKKVEKDGVTLTNAVVLDKPDKDFRAFFADLARKWHDFDVLLGYVDLCYLNKIQYLQLHLVDDQGWTMPLRSFPEAATKGACYTHEEMAYLVEYAHEASVELIPECECVGHSRELIKNCPEEFGNEYDGPMNEKIMCVGKPGIWKNVRTLLSEFAEVFKYSRYIHIGCDEALHTNWTACHFCRDYMARQGIGSTTELYAHFVARVVDICLSLGRTPLLWEGFHKEYNHLVSKDAVIMSWSNNFQRVEDTLASGFRVINAGYSPIYLMGSFPPDYSIVKEGFDMYRWNAYKDPAGDFDGTVIEPTDNMLGAMLCQWVDDYKGEREKVVNNMPTFSDRVWNEQGYYTEENMPDRSRLISMEKKVY
ncbi:MAG: family 20 glycosylhydrolase [Clostridia bacterium]|nr:family 20 glycosylhydrolase [Clostridia bacterium]